MPAHLLGDDAPTPTENEPVAPGATAVFAALKDVPPAGATATFAAPIAAQEAPTPINTATAVFAALRPEIPAAGATATFAAPSAAVEAPTPVNTASAVFAALRPETRAAGATAMFAVSEAPTPVNSATAVFAALRPETPAAGATATFAVPEAPTPVNSATAVFAALRPETPAAGATATFAAPVATHEAPTPISTPAAPAGTTQFRLSMPPPAIVRAGAAPEETAQFRIAPAPAAPAPEATAQFRALAIPAAPSEDLEATATLRLGVPLPTLDQEPTSTLRIGVPLPTLDDEATSTLRVAVPATDPDHQATAMLRVPVPAATPDSEATSTLRVAVPTQDPDYEATSTFRVSAPAANPDNEATSMLRVAVPVADPDREATSTLRVAAPSPDHEATSMARIAVPVNDPDREATSTLRVAAPSPDNVATAMLQVDGTAPTPLMVAPVALAAPPAAPKPAAKKGGLAGRLLGGRFEVATFLGSGTFGSTWVATDKRLKRECVVKVLRPMSSDPSALELEMRLRFANEAVTLAHLIHPNITQVFDHGEETDGTSWIAMEYVQGTPLSNIGREERTLDPTRVANIAAQLSSALSFAHSRGIVHRDLKPDNILILREHTGGEIAKVLDFGIARITDPGRVNLDKAAANVTQVGAFLGTPAFMSPEQAEGGEVGPESDVYSLGVLLYLLLTGVLPGNVPTAWNPMTTVAYVHSPFEPVRKLRPEVSPVLAEFVERMLVKNPKARTFAAARAAQELGALVAAAGGHRTVVAQAAKPEEDTLAEDTPKRTALVAGLVAVAVIGGGIAGLIFSQRGKEQPPAPVAVAPAPVPAPLPAVDPRVVREVAIQTLVSRARAGAPFAEIEAQARELAANGEDARLALARGIAHKEAKSWDAAVTALGEAEIRGAGSAIGEEATTLKRAVLDAQAAQERAEAEKREKKKRPAPEVVRPEY